MKTESNLTNASILRQKAVEQLEIQKSKTNLHLQEIDQVKLIHELEVHQIELEMQNEELVIAKEKAETAEEKYTELYDFAPCGYLTLSKDGRIVELNFAAAQMLYKERSSLITSNFALFLSEDSRLAFKLFLMHVNEGMAKQTCEAIIAVEGNLPINIIITGTVLSNGNYILVFNDITNLKNTEIALIRKTKQLEYEKSNFVGREHRMIELKREVNELLVKAGLEKKYMW
jgi:PAS domain-containing protein